MRILLASSEVHPFSKTGGLADMVGALGKYLAKAGARVGIVTPLYEGIRQRFPDLVPTATRIKIQLGGRTLSAGLSTLSPSENLTIYFIDQPAFFGRKGVYGEAGSDYTDNAERYIFFSKCVVHLARTLRWRPEIVHVHDWQTGAVPLLVHHSRTRENWRAAPKTVFTVHNLAYQGHFPASSFPLLNLPWTYFAIEGAEFYGGFNCMKTGIYFSDLVTTVSPTYAREIMTTEFGCGLEGLLRQRENRLVGILNGVDYAEWKTVGNPYLDVDFSADDLAGKTQQKRLLQRELGLPEAPETPLFGTVSRLADQKGMDILVPALDELLNTNVQFALLGTGQREFESAFAEIAKQHPSNTSIQIRYDNRMAHLIEAASDFFVMPSHFEPCGLNQMYSLRYGAIPIVRRTGGLDDSVVDATDELEAANGVKFSDYSTGALVKALHKGLALASTPELLQHYRLNGMNADFSWDKSAAEYLSVYDQLLRS